MISEFIWYYYFVGWGVGGLNVYFWLVCLVCGLIGGYFFVREFLVFEGC